MACCSLLLNNYFWWVPRDPGDIPLLFPKVPEALPVRIVSCQVHRLRFLSPPSLCLPRTHICKKAGLQTQFLRIISSFHFLPSCFVKCQNHSLWISPWWRSASLYLVSLIWTLSGLISMWRECPLSIPSLVLGFWLPCPSTPPYRIPNGNYKFSQRISDFGTFKFPYYLITISLQERTTSLPWVFNASKVVCFLDITWYFPLFSVRRLIQRI